MGLGKAHLARRASRTPPDPAADELTRSRLAHSSACNSSEGLAVRSHSCDRLIAASGSAHFLRAVCIGMMPAGGGAGGAGGGAGGVGIAGDTGGGGGGSAGGAGSEVKGSDDGVSGGGAGGINGSESGGGDGALWEDLEKGRPYNQERRMATRVFRKEKLTLRSCPPSSAGRPVVDNICTHRPEIKKSKRGGEC